MTNPRQRASDVKVGLFVALGLVLLTASIFLIGQERRLFEKPVFLKAKFTNVAGLKEGAQVRLAGVDVGIVSKIEFPVLDPAADSRVMPPTDLSTAKVGDKLPLARGDFQEPINLLLTGVDPAESLECTVEFEGTDASSEPVTERIQVRVRGRETSTAGKVQIRKLKSATIVTLSGNGPGTKIQVGDANSRKITVVMRVSSEVLEKIRYDSEARVDSAGLLGDKTIDISIGSLKRPPHENGDVVTSQEGVDLTAVLADSGRILENILVATDQVRGLLEGFRKAGGERTVIAAVQSIQDIAEEIQKGQGLIHQLIFDKKTGAQYQDIVAQLASASKKVDGSLAQVDTILTEFRTGDSLAHELVYGQGGDKAITEARGLIGQATQIVSDVRTEPGFIHNLIYEKDKGEILANINAATVDVKELTADAKSIVKDVKAGKGTVGALLVDPSVYEDIKLLLGNVRRNDAVKALVRFAVEQKEKEATKPPGPAPQTPAPPK